jgi:hypothetical protein
MTALTVTSDTTTAPLTASVLASLPVSYAPSVPVDPADVVVIAGDGAGWPAAAVTAIDAGSTAVIVVDPQPADLRAVTEPADGRVVIDWPWASNPALPSAASAFTAAVARGSLLEVTAIIDPARPLTASLLDLAGVVRRLVGPLTQARLLHDDQHGLTLSGTAATRPVALTLTRSTAVAGQARVRLLTDDGGIELTLPDPVTARPAEVTITDQAGLHIQPTSWESSHRATWRRARILTGSPTAATDLAELRHDQDTLAEALSQLHA